LAVGSDGSEDTSIFDIGELVGGFTDWFNSIISGIGNIVNYLNPASDSFFLKVALIPSDGYLSDRYTEFQSDMLSWLGYSDFASFLDSIQGVTSSEGTYTATIDVYGVGSFNQTFVDTSYYNANKTWIYTVIRGVLAVMAYIYNLNQFYKLLNRGGSLSDSITQIQGGALNK
jgi:hypothetical protein